MVKVEFTKDFATKVKGDKMEFDSTNGKTDSNWLTETFSLEKKMNL